MDQKHSVESFETVGKKKQFFFAWYYDQGLHELFELWKNFLLFFWRYFSIADLLVTLLYPWRRDLTARNWRGWSPKKSLHLFLQNFFSRIIGAIVRILVIACGISILSITFIAGLLSALIWLCFPFFVAYLLYSFAGKSLPLGLSGLFFLNWLAIVLTAYLLDKQSSAFHLGFEAFYDHKLSKRLCHRLGMKEKRFPQGILDSEQELNKFLKEKNITFQELQGLMSWEFKREDKLRISKKFWRWENLKKIKPLGCQWKYGYTVNLDKYAVDLSEFDPTEYRREDLIGRDDELEVLRLVLERPDQNCALIVGETGIGKKTLIHYFARTIRHNRSDAYLNDTRVMLLDLGRAISDAINRGLDVENEMRTLFYEASYAGNVILVIEHLEHYLGKEGSMFHPDLAAVLSEYLSLPSFQLVATSTTKEYHNLIEKEGEVCKYFEVIEMREPAEARVLPILLSKLEKYEHKHVIFTFAALQEIIAASAKHNWQVPMPERAIDLAMDILVYWSKRNEEVLVTEKTVSDFIALKTGIPQGEIQTDERKKLLQLEKLLHRHVIGQEEAVKQVSEALRRARSGINNSQKPIGSFLFIGPTGVGKTEMAKALARAYFGDEKHMIRFDMSEFQTPSSIDRLIGSSQLNQQGRLTTQIKDNPYSLILLDELEKAYPEILNVFLQILDEGFVTDAFGEKVNFRNAIIIATSNAGAPLIKEKMEKGEDPENIKQAIIDETVRTGVFRLEFLNRFNGVIFFRPLNSKELKSVANLLLQKLSRRLSKEKSIDIAFNESVVDKLIQKGYNPIFGARSLDHYIERTIEDLVATKIISGEVKKGERITVSL
jgi:ATP-dependent Clp protease ATP-binding subunit ClpC